ncbi:polysaccharide biosynthesis tyrosine autokinase [Rhodococcus hoagii]|uniref:polysaccharide biosynthesis tyrosine autokinase n=1 Tax=Rhodococcus hoagii TaxID=43767 RepID=UPI0019633463|nr:polysaccharide biosynthesis tyrosine autokinase [Prescottella equi]MBM9838420.1 polysaccharide biosynthesis tyrosine autokinase [Prescottella equi]
MEIQDYVRIVAARWRIIAVTTVVAILVALVASLISTPIYAAKARLFVSTSGSSVMEAMQGNQFSQQRVSSYAKLATGQEVAAGAIAALGVDLSPSQLASRVRATPVVNTVLFDLEVSDADPVRAQQLTNAVATSLTAKIEALESNSTGQSSVAKATVVEPAKVPSTPVSPKTKRNLGLGCIIGLLAGVILAVVRDRLDNTVKSRETLDELAGVGMTGAIPFDKEREQKAAIAFQDGYSSSAEAFRELRTNLQFLEVDNPPRIIEITSSLPGEGKTTTAINLSLALAEAGYSVCLVDADLRRPRVAKYLDLIGSVGMSTVLSAQADLDDALQTSAFANVSVLAAGSLPPNPSELLGSTHAEKLFDELRAKFDFVIIDASPLLPVTDAAVLAVKVDGCLVVVRHGKTKREQVSRAIGNLRSVGATVLGTILTMTPSKGQGSYEYKYYYDSDMPVEKIPVDRKAKPAKVATPTAG